ncbi:MAG: bifunctional adenosylcobinamide kinase/adenosylcobinamide-phosphate guanylyltransferase [Deltaproteobacteria bacterium]|nr:bifunctional adenosylcobinamide kinase/adenosylcobinamide-phosphate guanylyltransferase [Deltaproteobacteria bacterium]
MGEIILFLGGAKSGKTKAALAAAEAYNPPRYYLATALALDQEMRDKISRHQKERGPDWQTIEEPIELAAALLKRAPNLVLIDCLTLWLTNLLTKLKLSNESFMDKVEELIRVALERAGPVVIVSNEVGGGIVPMEPLSRFFRDICGLAHQRLAAAASSVFFVNAGLCLKLK